MTSKCLLVGVGACVCAGVGYAGVSRWKRALVPANGVPLDLHALQQLQREMQGSVVVVDIGSSSVRASAFALIKATPAPAVAPASWQLIDGSLQQIPLAVMDESGQADLPRLAATVEQVLDMVLEFLRQAKLSDTILAVGFSTFVMNLVGVDSEHRPVTPLFTYAGRSPSTIACARELREVLQARGSEQQVHDRTGTVIHPAYAAAEFLRLHREQPSDIERIHKWQSLTGYLLGKWMATTEPFSHVPMSFTEASWTGLLDFRRQAWDAALLDLVHMPLGKMPDVKDSSTSLSGLNAVFAQRWPELQRVPFFLGIGDGAAANIGSKCVDASRIAVTVGTSAAIRVVLPALAMEHVKVPRGLWCYRISEDRVLLGGAMNDGGSVNQWISQLLRLGSQESVDEELKKMLPLQSGLTMLPFLTGERAPGWRDDAKCTITGITKWTSPLDLLHAGLEAVALQISAIHALLAPSTSTHAKLIASGTALTRSKIWRQIIADAVGKEVIVEQSAQEATSRGVAVCVGVYLGLHAFEDTIALDADAKHCKPDASIHARYLDARHQQQSLYRKLYNE